MKKITLLMLFLSTVCGYSQLQNYTFSQTIGTYTELTGVTTSLGNTSSDQQYFLDPAAPLGATVANGPGFEIPFDFIYNGDKYNRFAVNANGWISLGSSDFTPSVNAFTLNPFLPLSTTYGMTEALSTKIAALAGDLSAQANASIQFQVLGSAPNRILVIQWKNYRKQSAVSGSFNFQIRLSETTNTVEFVYGTFTATSKETAYQVGLRAAPATNAINFVNRTSTGSWDNTTAGTAAGNTVNMTDVFKPAFGLTFTWTPPTCGGPKSLSVTNLTSNSATLSWGSALPAPSGYEYSYSTSATLPTGAGKSLTNPTDDITKLEPDTKYNVFVRTVCGTQFTQWVDMGSFKTKCADASTFSENFDSYATGYGSAMPDCWSAAGNGGTYLTNAAQSVASAPNKLYMSAVGSGTVPTVAYAILPAISNLSLGTHRLKFKAFANSTDRTFDVGYLKSDGDFSTFTSLKTIDLPYSEPVEFIVVPKGVPSGVKNLVFRNAGTGAGAGETILYIDDVLWQFDPACTDINNLLVKNITTNSAKVSWDVTGEESTWQYAISNATVTDPATLPQGSFVNVDMTTVTVDPNSQKTRVMALNNLTPGTSYKIWVRSKCSDSAFGYWLSSAFSTFCLPAATFSEDFDANTTVPSCWRTMTSDGALAVVPSSGSASSNALKASGSYATGVWVGLPPVSTAAAGYRLKFKYRANSTGLVFKVVNLQDPTNITASNWTEVANVSIPAQNVQYVFSGAFSGTTPYFALRIYHTTLATTVYLDDVVWEPIPTCPDVTGLVVNGIAGDSADLGWSTGSVENNWQYAVSSTNAADPNTLTPSNFASPFVNGSNVTATMSGLMPSTSYKYWIRSKCNSGSFGGWIGPKYFKTSCSAIADFVQSFDASTDLPSCWNTVTGTAVVAKEGTTSNNILKIDSQGIVAMQPVNNSADNSHILRFKLSGSAIGAKVELGYTTNPGDPSKFVSLSKFSTVASTTLYSSESAELGYDPASQILAFRNAGSGQVYIDDVVWESLPLCLDVSGITINDVTSTTCTLSLTKGGTETMWQYAKGDVSATDAKDLQAVDFVSPTVAGTMVTGIVGGLSPSTSYKVWLRSKCTTYNFGAWKGPFLVNTLCTSIDNFSENFDANTNIPACWRKVGSQGTVAVEAVAGPSAPNALKLTATATEKAIVAMPPVTNATNGNQRLRFKFRSTVANGNIEVGYLTNIADQSSFGTVSVIAAPEANVFYHKSVVMGLNQISGVLAFRNPDNSTIYIDDVIWEFNDGSELGTDVFETNNFVYYPNPVNDVLTMSLNEEITNVSVFNLLGQQVINQSSNGNQVKVDMSGLMRGAYLIKVISSNQSKTIKVIKE